MSFVYPAASLSIIRGKDFYRIKAEAVNLINSLAPEIGPGDMIPIDVGFAGISVGPQSDYDRYELFYPDPIAQGNYQRIEFSTKHPLLGRFDIDNKEQVPASNGEVAKAFIRPLGVPASDFTNSLIINALTDVIVYTGAPPSQIPIHRAPRVFEGDPAITNAGLNYFFMPCFGRRHLSAHVFASGFPVPTVTFEVLGLRSFMPLVAGGPGGPGSQNGRSAEFVTDVRLLAPAAVPVFGTQAASFGYDCITGGKGFFDYMQVRIVSNQNVVPSTTFLGAPGSQKLHLIMEARD